MEDLRVDLADMRRAVKIAGPFVAKKDVPSLRAVRVREAGGRVLVEATDRYVAVVVRLPEHQGKVPQGFDVSLPWGALRRATAVVTRGAVVDGSDRTTTLVVAAPSEGVATLRVDPGPSAGTVEEAVRCPVPVQGLEAIVTKAMAAPPGVCQGFPVRASRALRALEALTRARPGLTSVRVYPRAEGPQAFEVVGLRWPGFEVVGAIQLPAPPEHLGAPSALFDALAEMTA